MTRDFEKFKKFNENRIVRNIKDTLFQCEKWSPHNLFHLKEDQWQLAIFYTWKCVMNWVVQLDEDESIKLVQRLRDQTGFKLEAPSGNIEELQDLLKQYLIHNALDVIRTFLFPLLERDIGGNLLQTQESIRDEAWATYIACRHAVEDLPQETNRTKWLKHIAAFKESQALYQKKMDRIEERVKDDTFEKTGLVFTMAVAVILPIDAFVETLILSSLGCYEDMWRDVASLFGLPSEGMYDNPESTICDQLQSAISAAEGKHIKAAMKRLGLEAGKRKGGDRTELVNRLIELNVVFKNVRRLRRINVYLLDAVCTHLKSRLSRIVPLDSGATKSIADVYQLVEDQVMMQFQKDRNDTPEERDIKFKANVVQVLAKITTDSVTARNEQQIMEKLNLVPSTPSTQEWGRNKRHKGG